ncbi:MAG: hypothetical protein NC211_03755 [Alistipes senegalensis]|nr:hypothetical protein [Oxalobacter formigenes]MCM1280933.1 hypothetical protein [Alistipes senegalensis]
MKKDHKHFFEALVSAEQSAENIRNAFKNFAITVANSQSSFDSKKKKIEKEMQHGARQTTHRIRI